MTIGSTETLCSIQCTVITELENRLDDAISAFINVVGHEPVDLTDPVSRDYLIPASLDEALSVALDNHPRLKSADADIDAAREQHNAAKSVFYPRVHLEIQGSHNENQDGVPGQNDQASVMVRGRYNLTGGKDMARREETVFQRTSSVTEKIVCHGVKSPGWLDGFITF